MAARLNKGPASQTKQLSGQCISPSNLMSRLLIKHWKQVTGTGAPGAGPRGLTGDEGRGDGAAPAPQAPSSQGMTGPAGHPSPPQL